MDEDPRKREQTGAATPQEQQRRLRWIRRWSYKCWASARVGRGELSLPGLCHQGTSLVGDNKEQTPHERAVTSL